METTIGEVEDRLLAEFEEHRELTEDEIDESEATGQLRTRNLGSNDEESTQSWRAAAIRRRSDVYTRNLYDVVRVDQIQAGISKDDILPNLQPWELVGGVLGWEPDRALFRHLQILGAFRVIGMESERRTSPDMSDEASYEQLRNTGARYTPARHGWFRYGKRVLSGIHLDPANEEEEFDRLSEEGAFRTLGITRSFRDVQNLLPGRSVPTPTDYDIFQTTRNDTAHFHADELCWFDERHNPLYGDVPADLSIKLEKIWEDRRTGFLFTRAGADADVLDYVENLWLGL